MSTISGNNPEISRRKARHIEVCVSKTERSVEAGSAGFESIKLPHRALPEISWNEIDLRTKFLDRSVNLPLFISCMTGGSAEGHRANKDLARAAQELGIPVGLGSHRILFEHPELMEHFWLRPLAPDVPILSNIGAVQVRDIPHVDLIEMNKRLEVDAQVIHLNPAQELFQEGGDRDFRRIREAIARFIDVSPLPVIVKETGCGLGPHEVLDLVGLGAVYVDVAGYGGTSWILVEAARGDEQEWQEAQEFHDWGWPTAEILLHLRGESRLEGKLLASGGIRTAMDIGKSLALGATMAGMALPLIRAVIEGGSTAVIDLVRRIEKNLKRVLLLTGSKTPRDLSRLPLRVQK